MPPPHPVLVLFAHPATHRSQVNVALRAAAEGVEGVHLHDLYETYPEFDVRVREEQDLLLAHDVIVLQHPLYWYSCPAIVKHWLDLVLEHGWAYGTGGTALRGKVMLSAVTTGGTRDSYHADGFHHAELRQLLLPFERTADLCGMRSLAPYAVHGSLHLGPAEIAAHARDYAGLLEALRDGRLDLDAASRADRLRPEAVTDGR